MSSPARYSALGAATAFVATFIAVFLYMVVIVRERPSMDLVWGAVFFGLNLALRGALVGALAGALLCFVRLRLSRAGFVATSAITAALLGAALGFFIFRRSQHVSPSAAAGLLALTWAVSACSATIVTTRHRAG